MIPGNLQSQDYGIILNISLTLNLINSKLLVSRNWDTDVAMACSI